MHLNYSSSQHFCINSEDKWQRKHSDSNMNTFIELCSITADLARMYLSFHPLAGGDGQMGCGREILVFGPNFLVCAFLLNSS